MKSLPPSRFLGSEGKRVLLILPRLDDRSSPLKGVVALIESFPTCVFRVLPIMPSRSVSKIFENRCTVYRPLTRSVSTLLVIWNRNRDFDLTISLLEFANIFTGFLLNRSKSIAYIRSNLVLNVKDDYPILWRLITFLHLRALQRFPTVWVLNSTLAFQLQSMALATNIRVAPNLLQASFLNFAHRYRQRLTGGTSTIRMIVVGSLTSRKAPCDALRFLKRAISFCEERIELHYYGSGGKRGIIERLALEMKVEHLVHFHGYDDCFESIYFDFPILLHPSCSEGESRTLLEAAVLGLTIVARRTEENVELLGEYSDALLFQDISEVSVKALLEIHSQRTPCNYEPYCHADRVKLIQRLLW